MHHTRMMLAMQIAGLLLLSACGGEGESVPADGTGGFPITMPSCERQVIIKQRPERVLTVASDSSTAVAAAGAADRIVARSAEGGAPLGRYSDELTDVPQATRNGEPSREVIIGQQPDLVGQLRPGHPSGGSGGGGNRLDRPAVAVQHSGG